MVKTETELLKGVVEERGWKALFLDVDDSAANSNDLWSNGFSFFDEIMSQRLGTARGLISTRVAQINDVMYETMGVHPRKYGVIAQQIAGEFKCDERETREAMKRAVEMIYLGIPSLYPETGDVLKIAQEVGLQTAFVTHSPLGRIKRMMMAWDLWGKVSVFVESTLQKKGPAIWERALQGFDLTGDQGVMAGDNLDGDVLAAGIAGIRDRVWIKPKWKKYGEGQVPKDVPTIDGIGQLVQTLITNF